MNSNQFATQHDAREGLFAIWFPSVVIVSCRYLGATVLAFDAQHWGGVFESCAGHNEDTISIGERGNCRPSHRILFPRENSETCLISLLSSESSLPHPIRKLMMN